MMARGGKETSLKAYPAVGECCTIVREKRSTRGSELEG